MKLYNIVKVYTSTVGTGTVTLGSAVPSFITFATAGVVNGSTVSYAIEDGNNREVGTGTYTSGAETLTRSVVTSTNSNNLITLSGNAVVFITGLAADLSSDTANVASTLVQRDGSGNFAAGAATLSSAVVPLIIGGTGTTSTLTLRSTSGVGTTGADIIFQTGNNGATEVMRLQNGGNVGIGTSSLFSKFTVSTSGENFELNPGLASVWDGGVIEYFNRNSASTRPNFNILTQGAFKVYTGGSNERMRILSTGEVGIGTSSPGTKLDILGANGTTQQIYYRSSDTNWYGRIGQIVSGNTIGSIISSGGAWSVSGATFSATKDFNGSFPTAALYIGNQYNSALETSFRFLRKAAGSTTTDGAVTELMTIDNSGNVGIGTSSITSRLTVASTSTPFESYRQVAGSGGNSNALSVLRDNAYSGGTPTNNDSVGVNFRLKDSGGNYQNVGAIRGIITDVTGTGAGSLSLATKGASDTFEVERMRIDSSGNVAIGTTSTPQQLTLGGYGAIAMVTGNTYGYLTHQFGATNGADYVSLASNYRRTDSASGTIFNTGAATSEIALITAGAQTNIAFSTNSAANTAPTERMRIDFNGSVGIGTSSPSRTLDVNGSCIFGNVVGVVAGDSTPAQIGVLTFGQSTTSTYAWIQSWSSRPLAINPSGNNVGIGTSSPNTKLEVAGTIRSSSSGATEIQLVTSSATNTTAHILGSLSSSGSDFANLIISSNATRFNISGSEKVRIDSGGNVGIGTSSPLQKLDVVGNLLLSGQSTANQYIWVGYGRSGNGFSYIDLQGDTTYGYGTRLIRGNTGANSISSLEHRGTGDLRMVNYEAAPICFYTSSSEKVRIDSSGNLLVGTTSSLAKLTAAGGTAAGAVALVTSGQTGTTVRSNSVFRIQSEATGRDVHMQFSDNVTNATEIGMISGSTYFCTGALERMRILSTGEVGIGTGSPGYPLDVRAAIGQLNIQSSTGTNYSRLLVQNTGGSFQIGIDSSVGAAYGTGGYSRVIWSDSAYPLVLTTNGTERMRIDSSGNVGIGTTSVATSAKLEIAGTTGALLVPRLTTTERNALTAVNGMIIYNTTDNQMQGRINGAWVAM